MRNFASISVLVTLAAVAASAPASPDTLDPVAASVEQETLVRDKRSQYSQQYPAATAPYAPAPPRYKPAPAYPPQYGPQYGPYLTPCAAAAAQIAAAPAPIYNPHAPYSPHGYGYGPHYRADDEEENEMMVFSDMEPAMSEHIPMARYSYGVPAAGLGAPILAPGGGLGTAVGVFPQAVGGCNTPLLFSCAPSLVQGYLKPHYGYGASAGGHAAAAAAAVASSYRDADQSQEFLPKMEVSHQDSLMATSPTNVLPSKR